MVRRALSPLARVAADTRCAILLVRHLNKSRAAQLAMYRGSGSIGIVGSARIALLVAVCLADGILLLETNGQCGPPVRNCLDFTTDNVAGAKRATVLPSARRFS